MKKHLAIKFLFTLGIIFGLTAISFALPGDQSSEYIDNRTYDATTKSIKVTGVSGGALSVGGDVASDAVDSGNPVKIGGVASSSKPTAVADGDRVNAYFDLNGRLHTYDEGGGGVGGGGYMTYIFDSTNSLGQGQTQFPSGAVGVGGATFTVSGLSFTPTENNLVKIEQYNSSGAFVASFTPQQNTIDYQATSNMYTVTGATFATSDSVVVYQQGPERTTNLSTNTQQTVEANGINFQVVEESLVDTTNVASGITYYPSSLGMAMLGYQDISITGKFIDADATRTTSLIVQATNDEDTTNADWVSVYGYVAGLSGLWTATGNTSTATLVAATGQTATFAWDFDNLNYRYVRVGLNTGDETNTSIIKARRK